MFRPDVRHWQGREDEIAQITGWLSDPAVQLVGVKATGGFGKSALVRKICEQVGEQASEPVSEAGRNRGFEKVLALTFSQGYAFSLWGRWLMAHFGERVADEVGDAALGRRVVETLQDHRVLLVMDNVETLLKAEGQAWEDVGYRDFVVGWLSEPGQSVVVMTSREEPTVASNLMRYCKWHNLDGLALAAGAALLGELGVLGKPAALRAFVGEAGGHPLLLKLAAGWLLVEEPEEPRLEYLDREVGGLNLFEFVGAHRGQPEVSVRRILEATLRRLPEQMRQLLPALSLYRLPFSVAAAQQMTATPIAEVDLRRLEKRALLQSKKLSGLDQSVLDRAVLDRSASDRVRLFEFQPLVQRYLRAIASKADHQKAIDYYRQVCKPTLESTDELADTAAYQEIFHHYCELGNYASALATLRTPTDEQQRYSSCDMVLQLRGYNAVRLTLYERIAQAWKPADSEESRLLGDTLQAMGDVLQFLDRRDEAIANYDEALGIYRQVGARVGEANTLKAMGDVLQFLKRSDEAIANYDEALGIYRQVGARLGEANTLKAMGDVLQFLKRSDEAIANYDEALGIYRQVGDRLGEANTLQAMGRLQVDVQQGVDYLQSAQTLYEQIGDVYSQGVNLYYLGGLYAQLQQYEAALSAFQTAITLGEQISFAPLVDDAKQAIQELNSDDGMLLEG